MKTLGAAFLLAPSLLHAVPTEIARESFEGTAGSIGYTTSVPQFIELATSPFTDYFSVIPNNGTKVGAGRTLAGADGASIFAGEDCDTARTSPAVAGPQEVFLTTNAVNITGKINTQVRILMAAPGRQNTVGGAVNLAEYEYALAQPAFANKLIVAASVDGGAYQRLVQFSPNTSDGANSRLSFDADGNLLGGDTNPIPTNPTTLSDVFQEGIYPIPTGNTVQVRVTFESDATGELITFDNIRIFGEGSVTAPPAIAGVPTGNLIFTEGGAAATIASALTVSDTDSTTLSSASVVINQNLTSGEDLLAATPSGAILAGNIVYTAATGTLSITGAAPLADYQAVLRSVTYRNTNTVNPSTLTRRVAFTANDGTNPSNSPQRDIEVVDTITTQTIPFTESFETDGRGTRYSVIARANTLTPNPSFFDRTQPTDVTNLDGTWAFTVENVDDNLDNNETVAFNFNTTGFTQVTGKLRVAAPGGAVYDGGSPDFLAVEATTNGTTWNRVLAFYPLSSATSTMAVDTNNDNIGDGVALTAALQEFTFSLPTGAATLGLRMRAYSNVTGERILFDKLDVTGVLPATVASVSSSTANGPYKIGDTISVQVNFSQAVTVTGTPQLTLETGATDRTVNYASGSGTSALTFNYTVQAGDLSSDLDCVSTTALALNGGTIQSSAVNAVLTLPAPAAANSLGANKALVIDGVVPTVTLVTSSTANGTYKIGDAVSLQVNFSEAVTVIGTPQLTLETGATDRTVNYVSGSGTSTLTFTYTVQSGDISSDLDYQSTTALALNGGTIRDAAGNNATLTLSTPGAANSLGANKAIVIDGIRPTAGIVVADASLTLGETSGVTFTFSEAVSGFTNTDLTLANGTLTTVTTGDGGITWTATFTPTAAISDATNVITLVNTGIADAAGNTGTGTTDSNNYAIDTTSVSIAAVATSTAEGTGAGNTAFDFTVSRTGPTTAATTVNYAVSGAAVTAADFGGTLPSGSLSIPIGQASATLTINVSKDNLTELNEAFTVTLTSPSSGVLATATASETITNDDACVITFTGPTANEGDSGTAPFTYSISLSNPVDTAISFNAATLATGTASAGTDFTAVASTPINITSGTTTGSFSVTVTADRLTEPDETIIAQLSSLAAGGRNVIFSGAASTLNGTATIQNDDPAIVPGAASLTLAKGTSGKLLRTSILALATGGEGPLTLTAVQSTATAGGGTVTSADGWIIYQPAPTFTGADSFTYTLSDGFNTVNGTVAVTVSAAAGTAQTVNIAGITPEAGGNRVAAFAIPGRTYQFQTSSNLVTWTNLGTAAVCPANGALDILDPGPLPPTRFYRMVQAP